MASLRFPLFEKADRRGILDGASALIVAPTATGKSFIGQTVIRRALDGPGSGLHAYLVPYRSLAAEIYDRFLDEFGATRTRVRLLTGDHRDPVRPDQADLVVATYESYAGLLQRPDIQPGVIVADEIHLIADRDRGPLVEGLFARLLADRRFAGLCGLSAVVENGAALAEWLGVELLEGTDDDRPVPLELRCEIVDGIDEAVAEAVEPCTDGEQALVFCSSRSGTQTTAKKLAEIVGPALAAADRPALRRFAGRVLEADAEAVALSEAILSGVAFHHAGLLKPVRHAVEAGFRDGAIRVIACTPTLAAGVNLPANVAIVRDIFRGVNIRGKFRKVLLPGGEVLNMLGRAARPGKVDRGIGIALVNSAASGNPKVEDLVRGVQRGRGEKVVSRLPDRFESMMRFVLAVVAQKGEATRDDVASAYRRTLAHHASPETIAFDRPFEEDLMEDIPSWKTVEKSKGAIRVEAYEATGAGVEATVASKKPKKTDRYQVTLDVAEIACTCPAARQFYRQKVCKHEACAIHELLFGPGVDGEVRTRAIFACAHLFGRTLDPGTRLNLALEVLSAWNLLEPVSAAVWRVTPVGQVAAGPGFDLLLVRQAATRMGSVKQTDYQKMALWAVDDYLAEAADRKRWRKAVRQWIGEVDRKDLTLPTKWRGDFERGLEDLAAVCRLYRQAAIALGRDDLAGVAAKASAAVRYGVAPDLVPILGLGFPQLGRVRARVLYDAGIRHLDDLAAAHPEDVSDRRAPKKLVAGWIARALEIQQARAVADADGEEADAEFDELVARFRVDPDALS